MNFPRTFEDFVAAWDSEGGLSWGMRSLHVTHPGLRLYVRVALPFWKLEMGVDYVIATVDAVSPGKGAFTKFLDEYEPCYGLMVESVINPRFAEYLKRRGYLIRKHSGVVAPTMYKAKR